MAVGRRLRALRAEKDVSMNKVHLETRMSTSYLAKLERDEFLPGEDNLTRIVEALKALDVEGADVLYAEHKAVERERATLAALQERLADIEDPDERLELLDGFVTRIAAAKG